MTGHGGNVPPARKKVRESESKEMGEKGESFGDRHDDTVYFLMTYKSEIAMQNMERLQKLIYFFAIVYFASLVFSYVMVYDFQLHPSYFLVPLFLIICWKITDILRRKPEGVPFGVVRGFAFSFFLILAMLVIYIDGYAYPNSPTVLVPLLILSISAFYIDYLLAFVALEAVIMVMYIVYNVFVRDWTILPSGACICLSAAMVGVYSYWVILCDHTYSAYDKRVLKDEGSRDLLTGLYNKVSFEREVKSYLAGRTEEGLGVLMIIDFDNFKRVNDNYGHLVGDEILKKFGEILKKNFRVTDIVGRIGGDEFMVLMTGSVPENIIDMRCSTIEHELQTTTIGDAGGFSCSIGVAVDKAKFEFDELYLFADDALYLAKERGKATYVKRHANPGETPPEHKE